MMVTSPVVESALKTTDIARVLPHEGMILLVWTLGGFLTLAGALTYAELGALYPRAGGMYHYLKEAYGTFGASSTAGPVSWSSSQRACRLTCGGGGIRRRIRR